MRICRTNRDAVSRNRWGFAMLAALVLAFPCHAAGDSPIKSITVKYEGGTYITDMVMSAAVPVPLAWEVLTDFDQMAKFVPNVAESKILKKEGDSVTVEQKGQAKFGAASFPYVTERLLVLNKPTIKSTQTKGSMKRVESLMKVDVDGEGTKLTYHSEIVPSFLASTVMSEAFLTHEFTEQFTAIISEMTKRKK